MCPSLTQLFIFKICMCSDLRLTLYFSQSNGRNRRVQGLCRQRGKRGGGADSREQVSRLPALGKQGGAPHQGPSESSNLDEAVR